MDGLSAFAHSVPLSSDLAVQAGCAGVGAEEAQNAVGICQTAFVGGQPVQIGQSGIQVGGVSIGTDTDSSGEVDSLGSGILAGEGEAAQLQIGVGLGEELQFEGTGHVHGSLAGDEQSLRIFVTNAFIEVGIVGSQLLQGLQHGDVSIIREVDLLVVQLLDPVAGANGGHQDGGSDFFGDIPCLGNTACDGQIAGVLDLLADIQQLIQSLGDFHANFFEDGLVVVDTFHGHTSGNCEGFAVCSPAVDGGLGEVGQIGNIVSGQGSDLAGRVDSLAAGVGTHHDDVGSGAVGQRGLQVGVILGGGDGLVHDLDVGILGGEQLVHGVDSGFIFRSPTGELQRDLLFSGSSFFSLFFGLFFSLFFGCSRSFFLGCGGFFLLAAGDQGQDHQHGQQNSEQFFHFLFPLSN